MTVSLMQDLETRKETW